MRLTLERVFGLLGELALQETDALVVVLLVTFKQVRHLITIIILLNGGDITCLYGVLGFWGFGEIGRAHV